MWANNDSQAAAQRQVRDNVQTLSVAQPHRSVRPPTKSVGGGGLELSGDATVVAPHSPNDGRLADSDINTRNKRASIYTVRSGDTVSEIAELFDVSADTVVWANNLEGQSISPGDTLVILPVSGVRHEVEEGETVSGLAERYDVSTEKIRSYNELEDSQLAVGAILDIPGGEMPDETTRSHTHSSHASHAINPTKSAASGYYIHPLPGSHRTQGLHGYNAVDYGAPVGTPIRAAASGVVEKSVGAGWNGGYGQFVVIRHNNGTKTLYAHLSDTIVRRGRRVVQGQTIGYNGDTGRSTGPHLHFEVRGARNPF